MVINDVSIEHKINNPRLEQGRGGDISADNPDKKGICILFSKHPNTSSQ